jgi:hypothetical protein
VQRLAGRVVCCSRMSKRRQAYSHLGSSRCNGRSGDGCAQAGSGDRGLRPTIHGGCVDEAGADMTLRPLGRTVVLAEAAIAAYSVAVRHWYRPWAGQPRRSPSRYPATNSWPTGSSRLSTPSRFAPCRPHLAVAGPAGPGPGGLYSYQWLENLAGCQLRNTDRIIPELKHLQVYDPALGGHLRIEMRALPAGPPCSTCSPTPPSSSDCHSGWLSRRSAGPGGCRLSVPSMALPGRPARPGRRADLALWG